MPKIYYNGTQYSNLTMTPGIIQIFAGTTAPTGWLICDGSEVLKEDYPELYAIILDTYGTASDSDYFKLPDFRGRVPLGVGDGTANGHSAHLLGNLGGSEYIQAHTHGFTNPTITTHFASKIGASGTARDLVQTNGAVTVTTPITASGGAVGAVSGASTGTSGNMPPFITINYIISTGQAYDYTTSGSVEVVSTSLPLNTTNALAYGSSQIPTLYKSGNIVTLAGAFKLKNNASATGDVISVGTVPTGLRPGQLLSFVCQGSYGAVFLGEVEYGGNVRVSRYRYTDNAYNTYTLMTTAMWLPMTATWVATH